MLQSIDPFSTLQQGGKEIAILCLLLANTASIFWGDALHSFKAVHTCGPADEQENSSATLVCLLSIRCSLFTQCLRMPSPWTSRLSVAEVSTFRWSFEQDVLRYRSHGYEAMGIWRLKLADYGEAKGADFLEEHGMRVSSLHWAGGFTGHDGRTFREAMHDGLDAIELASSLRANSLVILAGSRSGHTRNHAKRLLTGALKELAEAASAVGVQLAVEPMHIGCAQDFTFLTSIPDTLDVIAKIGQPNLGIVFDSYHLGQDENVIDWLPSIVPLIRLVQLGDARCAPLGEQNRCMLGEGFLPLSSIVQVIESYEYDGFYEVELVGEDMENYDYDRLLADSRKKLVELSTYS